MGHLYIYERRGVVGLLAVYLLANKDRAYQIEDKIAARFMFKWLVPSTYKFSLTPIIMISHRYQKTGKER